MAPPCDVCGSPTANTLHFGARSCKACAAFYRRTVSMNMSYTCIGTGQGCKIHYELRMICRKCRFEACVKAGMRRELVQSKRDDKCIERSSSMASPAKKAFIETVDQKPIIELPRIPIPTSCDSPSTFNILHNQNPTTNRQILQTPLDSLDFAQTNNNYHSQNTVIQTNTVIQNGPLYISSYSSPFRSPEINSESNGAGDSNLMDPCTSTTPDSLINENTNFRTMDVYDEEVSGILGHYVQMEASLNDRRKIMFTDVAMGQVFHKLNECPYERRHLRPFNFRTFHGFDRHDFLMLYDFTHSLPEFHNFSPSEKNLMFRMSVAVDCMINSAYYTYRLGIREKLLVLWNGEYICMSPLPLSGDEPDAEQLFSNKADFTKYK